MAIVVMDGVAKDTMEFPIRSGEDLQERVISLYLTRANNVTRTINFNYSSNKSFPVAMYYINNTFIVILETNYC